MFADEVDLVFSYDYFICLIGSLFDPQFHHSLVLFISTCSLKGCAFVDWRIFVSTMDASVEVSKTIQAQKSLKVSRPISYSDFV